MSLVSHIGPRPNLLGLENGGNHKRLEVHQPILSNRDLEKIRRIEAKTSRAFQTVTLSMCYGAAAGAEGMGNALQQLCQRAEQAVKDGNNIIILSDREMDAEHIAIPALLATSAVHHHLIQAGLRTHSGLVIETGEAREVHHFALLSGYGAEAINPYHCPAMSAKKKYTNALSRPLARHCSRSCPRWAYPPTSPIVARRYSMPSALEMTSSTATSMALVLRQGA
jgi:hypothetical protein